MAKILEIAKTHVTNDYSSTAIASTVYAVDYKLDGIDGRVAVEPVKEALVLIVDGVQKNLYPGKTYEVENDFEIVTVKVPHIGGPAAAPWVGAAEDEKATYYYRQALMIKDGEIVDDASVTQLIQGGSYDAQGAKGVTITSDAPHFNGILLEGDSKFAIDDAKIYAYGDGSHDLAGWAAGIEARETAEVEIRNSYMETAGACRPAMFVNDTAIARVYDSVLYSQETRDNYEEFATLVGGMMKRVPFALGMEGSVRTLNVMAAGQGKFDNCIVVSTGWGALSTDSGTAFDNCGTLALEATNTLSGIGTLEVAQPGKEYTAKKTVNGVEYGFTVGGSGYVTYADSGIHNKYTNCEFYAPDYIQVFGSGRSGTEYIDSYLKSEHTAFMTQQAGGTIISLQNTTVDAVDGLLQIKSGAANTGFSNLIVDNSKINFSGASTRAKDGILCELVESDDAGNPGIMTYTINDHPEEAVATSSTVSDSTATFKNGDYTGDIYNCIYNYKQLLDVTVENATVTGLMTSSTALHVDLEGNLVPNGTVLNGYEGSKEYDVADYRAEKGGTNGDYIIIGRFNHRATPMLNNPVNVTLQDATWNVTGDCYLNKVAVDRAEAIQAAAPATITVKSYIVAGEAYADGTYTQGNLTIVVDSTEIEVADNGIADAGQTYGNVAYTFMSQYQDGTLDSKAYAIKRQNYIDGYLYYTINLADGYEIVSVSAENGAISENTAGGELAAYKYVLAPVAGATEMKVTVVVRK